MLSFLFVIAVLIGALWFGLRMDGADRAERQAVRKARREARQPARLGTGTKALLAFLFLGM